MNKTLLTVGTFDTPHAGHARFLRSCEQHADRVVVAVISDELVRKFKSESPLYNLEERLSIISMLGYEAIPSADEDHRRIIDAVAPNVMAIGSDWARKDWLARLKIDQDFLDESGIELLYIPYTRSISTTDIKNRVRGGNTRGGSWLDAYAARDGKPTWDPVDPNRAAQIVRDVDVAFHGKSFPSHGTLLGIMREGRSLPHDHDVDVCVKREDFDPSGLAELVSDGYQALEASKWTEPWMREYVGAEHWGELSEIVLIPPDAGRHEHLDLMVLDKGAGAFRYFSGAWHYLWSRAMKQPARGELHRIPSGPLDELSDATMSGQSIHIPVGSEDLMAWWYGLNWRSPVVPWYGSRPQLESAYRSKRYYRGHNW